MKTSIQMLRGAVVVTVAVAALSACTYHRTIIERPAATERTTVIVPDNNHRDVIVVPPAQ